MFHIFQNLIAGFVLFLSIYEILETIGEMKMNYLIRIRKVK